MGHLGETSIISQDGPWEYLKVDSKDPSQKIEPILKEWSPFPVSGDNDPEAIPKSRQLLSGRIDGQNP